MSISIAPLNELFYWMDDNIQRWPLPICFDADEERSAFMQRQKYLERLANRFVRMQEYKNSKTIQPTQQ